ncbi:MAG: hypothetical protein MAG453_00325 [Calditrichaeota bacterium]|nr:hypothetical protein [Calditrichota bacterium]
MKLRKYLIFPLLILWIAVLMFFAARAVALIQ